MAVSIEQLRSKLDEVVSAPDAESWVTGIAELRADYPHAIETLGYPVDKSYNCFEYAFGLATSAPYNTILAKGDRRVRVTEYFLRLYLPEGILVPTNTPLENDVVIYYYSGIPWHAAIYESRENLKSKWGTGPVFRHRLLEVPRGYGSPMHFKSPSNLDLMIDAFTAYARKRHVNV